MPKTKVDLVRDLNRMTPAARQAKIGDILSDLIVAHNALIVKHNALLTKMDADAGITDTNYTSTLTVASLVVTDVGSR